MRFGLNQNLLVIDAALQLHNSVVQNGLDSGKRHTLSSAMEFDDEVIAFVAASLHDIVGGFGDEVATESGGHRGRETAQNKMLKSKGKSHRDIIRCKLDILKLSRPKSNWSRTNSGNFQMS